MRIKQILLSAALLLVALLIQITLLARLNLPGVVPDLLLLVVIGVALVYGPRAGSLAGFFGGLLADLAPPADHAAGREALVLVVLGYAVGLVRRELGQLRSVLGPMLVVACAAELGVLLYAGVGAVVGDAAVGSVPLGELLVTALIYDVLLAPFVVPGVMWLGRKAAADPVSAALGGTADGVGAAQRGGSGPTFSKGTGLRMPRMRGRRGQLFDSGRGRTRTGMGAGKNGARQGTGRKGLGGVKRP